PRFLRNVGRAVPRVRVVAHPLGCAAACLLLDVLEYAGEVARIVAGASHHLHTEDVGLLLVLAAVLQHPGAEAELAALADDLPQPAADDGAGDRAGKRADLKLLRLGGVGGAVA